MIKELERKIMVVLMSIFTVIIFVVVIGINVKTCSSNEEKYLKTINKIAEYDGDKTDYFKDYPKLDHKFSKNNTFKDDTTLRLSQFYTVIVGSDGKITNIVNNNSGGYSDEYIRSMAETVLKKEKSEGIINDLLYSAGDRSDGKIIIFLDYSMVKESNLELLKSSITAGIIGIAAAFVISLILSKWIVRPVKEAFEKQKRFISDASHELKTPLTVITANADILYDELGENKWLGYIKSEADMMSTLVNKLLTLTRLESAPHSKSYTVTDLTRAVYGASMPFESVLFEKNIALNYDIDEDIHVLGDEYELRQVVGILMDNAVKHTENGGNINVSLKRLRGKAVLNVMNTGREIPKEEISKIFDRFYRADESRNRNDKRYGLGLSIAKAIVENHKGKIKAESQAGWNKFTISLALKE